MTFYRLSKISGRYERDPTVDELTKSKKDTIASVGDSCVGTALDFRLKLKGEETKTKKVKFLNIIFNYTLIMDLVLILG